ncbi:histone-fold-containing protein [Chytridium lagenaria]|nr:histone-fold-containing protein [Chytridium lagenaria]
MTQEMDVDSADSNPILTASSPSAPPPRDTVDPMDLPDDTISDPMTMESTTNPIAISSNPDSAGAKKRTRTSKNPTTPPIDSIPSVPADSMPGRKRAKKTSGGIGTSSSHSDVDTDAVEVNEADVGSDEEGGGIPVMASTAKLLTFPMSRVKTVMKEDEDVNMVATDAVVLMSMVTQLFLEKLTKDAWYYADSANRKTIAYKDVVSAVQHREELEFLEDVMLPLPAPTRKIVNAKPRSTTED